MGKKKILANQQGFTLIEIIAVLVLLGILAAVAVPKYMSMQEQAEEKTVAGVKAELQARANQYQGQYLLDQSNGTKAGLAAQVALDWADETKEDVGNDFGIARVDDTNLTITVNSSGNTYNLEFTVGTTGTNSTAARFGDITPN